jgi:hypothetical protein
LEKSPNKLVGTLSLSFHIFFFRDPQTQTQRKKARCR